MGRSGLERYVSVKIGNFKKVKGIFAYVTLT